MSSTTDDNVQNAADNDEDQVFLLLCCCFMTFTQRWVSFGKNLLLLDLRFKPVKSGENQNAGIVGWYKEFTRCSSYFIM